MYYGAPFRVRVDRYAPIPVISFHPDTKLSITYTISDICLIWHTCIMGLKSLLPGRCGSDFKIIFFQLITQNSSLGTRCEIDFMWMPKKPCSKLMLMLSPSGVTRPQCVSICSNMMTSRNENNSHIHDDVIKWKHFPRYWPFVGAFHRSAVNSPHKGQ